MMSSDAKQSSQPLAAIILAAGKGTRMGSDLPKVLHEVAGKTMVQWVVDAVKKAGAQRVILVVGHGAERVKSLVPDVEYVLQEPQLGTGHAVQVCKETLADFEGDILVLGGDGPLLRPSTIEQMIDLQRQCGSSGTLATSIIPDPTGYGRILRDEQQHFAGIVEHKNASPEQLEIHEVYPSYAIFHSDDLWSTVDALKPNELTNEYYFTEVPQMILENGGSIEIINSVAPEDILSINTPEQLLHVERVLLARLQNEMEPTA